MGFISKLTACVSLALCVSGSLVAGLEALSADQKVIFEAQQLLVCCFTLNVLKETNTPPEIARDHWVTPLALRLVTEEQMKQAWGTIFPGKEFKSDDSFVPLNPQVSPTPQLQDPLPVLVPFAQMCCWQGKLLVSEEFKKAHYVSFVVDKKGVQITDPTKLEKVNKERYSELQKSWSDSWIDHHPIAYQVVGRLADPALKLFSGSKQEAADKRALIMHAVEYIKGTKESDATS